jgi:hypothetical protein
MTLFRKFLIHIDAFNHTQLSLFDRSLSGNYFRPPPSPVYFTVRSVIQEHEFKQIKYRQVENIHVATFECIYSVSTVHNWKLVTHWICRNGLILSKAPRGPH